MPEDITEYWKEEDKDHNPFGGYVDFRYGTIGLNCPNNIKFKPQVGDFYIFPFTLMHSVNPFNGTDEIRRTLSWNCNLYKEPVFDLSKPQVVEEKEI